MFGRRKKDRSAPGPTLRHEAVERGWRAAAEPDPVVREEFDAHVARFLGEDYVVWHELASDTIHLDVYMWAPTPDRPFYTFVTSGMSDRPMTTPHGAREQGVTDLAELVVCLPEGWPVPEQGAAPWDDESYFPIFWLKSLARLPSEYDTWLGFGHTIPNGDPAEPLTDGSDLVGWVLLPPMTLPDEGRSVDLPGGRRIDLFGIIAVTAAELDRKLATGVASLFSGFDAQGVNEVLDVGRRSTV
jgi:hypothetical protein